ncbi:MAG TPA: lipoyl synthase [Vicinamibacteria bacterium]
MSASVPLPLLPRPAWIRARAPQGPAFERLQGLMRGLDLHTVCEEAHCPNLGECWSRGTATFMILGEVCTRACGFCAVKTGLPGQPPDPDEPRRVAEAVARMGLRHAVVTSVNRDDQPDGGASLFAATIAAIRAATPACAVEVLVPDFKGRWDALERVLEAKPDVLNHNVETVPRLYRQARAGASFPRSIELLQRSRKAGLLTKSGIMVGLGEKLFEVEETIRAIRAAGTNVLTVGQYLRPSPRHLPVRRYWSPSEFESLRALALSLGFAHVESGPLVRSSYHAESHVPAGATARTP